ncbi:hypothetical protein J5U46_05955 [Micromonospora tulbaghiae]|uniref:DUF4383 domain-containing protein n=1 Tax=Micromonospora tulbaghiae TaxID=479978 RepID=A0AAW4JEA8_9ACTN|nr:MULTISPECIES: hypothetical protein [Micromonospora]MBO4139699.1 hypothetical protein [Micromonospora tulbaghiae]MCO1617886.1 hypothetical protein [Micromonospora sp. CPM1]
MRAVWFMWAGAFLSLANVAAGWGWALVDADLRLMTSAPQGIDWSQTSVWLGVPAALSVVLMTAAIRRSMALLSVGAVMMGVLFVPCGAWALFINHKGMDGANLDSWAVAAHLVGMFLALPVVVIAGWLHCRDSG